MNSKKPRSRISPLSEFYTVEKHDLLSLPNGQTLSFTSGKNVVVQTGPPLKSNRDSARVQSRILSEYKWDCKLYNGNLVDVHHQSQYVAYILYSRNGSAVRVYHRSSYSRQLIRGFSGECVDLGWAQTPDAPMLACVDQAGNIYVYVVVQSAADVEPPDSCDEGGGSSKEPSFTLQKHLVITRDSPDSPNGVTDSTKSFRLVWCPYVPEPSSNGRTNDGDQPSTDSSVPESASAMAADAQQSAAASDDMHLLAVIKGRRVELIMINAVRAHFESEEVRFDELIGLPNAYAVITEKAEVTTATLSPDATALALGTADGHVRFYILENLDEVRFAHSWQPHIGKPVDVVAFLDNLKEKPQEQFWKFALTAADGCRDLRLWNCENWKCVGALRVEPPPLREDGWNLLLHVDRSAQFVLMSDLDRNALYCIELAPDAASVLRFASFSDFPLYLPLLDFAPAKVQRKMKRPFSPADGSVEIGDDGPREVHADLIAINHRSLLELKVTFKSAVLESAPDALDADNGRMANLTQDDTTGSGFHDMLSDVSGPAGNSFDIHALLGSAAKLSASVNAAAREADAGRKTSDAKRSSPDSQEVRSILEHAPDVVDDDHDGDDEDEEDVDDEEGEDEHRPDTPVAHTLAAEDDEGNWAPNVMDAVDAKDPHVIKHLADAVNKMSMELERLASHADRQHSELDRFRSSEEHLMQRFLEAQKQSMDEYWQLFRPPHDAAHDRDQMLADAVRRLEPSLKAELSRCVMSTLGATKDAIESDLAEKVAASDVQLRDSMTKLAKSKSSAIFASREYFQPVADAFGRSVAESVSQQVAVAYNDAIRTTVVPSFDSLTRSLFEQLNETFKKGVKEYVDQLERQTRTVRETNDEWKSQVMNHLTNVTDQMRAMLERHINSLTASLQSHMDKQIQSVAKRLQDSVVESVRTLVREETNRAVTENQQSLNESLARIYRSQAGTPVSVVGTVDRQAIYKDLLLRLQSRDFNGAFEQALSVCDLSAVMFVCTKVDPKQLFSREPCPLKQPIVLSLLQQLTADLSTHTELKLKYVEEALMSIDVKNPEVIPHLQSVLTQTNESIQNFLRTNPSTGFQRQAKMFLLTIKSLASQ